MSKVETDSALEIKAVPDVTSPTNTTSPVLIAFVNFKSGGKKGKEVIKILERELGSDHVFNLEDKNPGQHIEKFRGCPDLRIIACGGDGTVNWILSTVTRLKLEPAPSVSIIPLGTGNDTSRHFGWGHKLRDEATVVRYINEMKNVQCRTVLFDRWQIFISLPKSKIPVLHPFLRGMSQISEEEYQSRENLLHPFYTARRSSTEVVPQEIVQEELQDPISPMQRSSTNVEEEILTPTSKLASSNGENGGSSSSSEDMARLIWSFNNYFSFGIDAQIMDSFHRHRERSPGCYPCRCCTMTWVGLWSPINCCCSKKLPLLMDVEVLLPKSETGTHGAPSVFDDYEWVPSTIDAKTLDAFILLNLPTYAGGRNIWGTDGGKKSDRVTGASIPSTVDGKLEVLGFDSYTHMSIAVGLQATRAHRLHQISGIRFNVKDNMYIQLDGEAWLQDCGTIEIVRAPSVTVLKNSNADVQGKCLDC